MELELPSEVMVHLMDEMSNTEERLAHGGSERLQLGSLVGAFATARYPVCGTNGKEACWTLVDVSIRASSAFLDLILGRIRRTDLLY